MGIEPFINKNRYPDMIMPIAPKVIGGRKKLRSLSPNNNPFLHLDRVYSKRIPHKYFSGKSTDIKKFRF